jgi:hypothetical protein
MAAPLGFYDASLFLSGWYDNRGGEILSWFDETLVTGTVVSETVVIDGQQEPLTVCDSYVFAPFTIYYAAQDRVASGQSFLGNGGYLRAASFWLYGTAPVKAHIYAELWSHTGVYGSVTGLPNQLLAVSEIIDAATISAVFQITSKTTFVFKGVNRVQLVNGTPYYIVYRSLGSTINAGGTTSNSHQEVAIVTCASMYRRLSLQIPALLNCRISWLMPS